MEAGDLTEEGEILSYIRNHELRAIVTREGECFVVEGEGSRRVRRGLFAIVRSRLRRTESVQPISPIEFSTWKNRNRPKSGRERSEGVRRANAMIPYLFGEAIRLGASDLILDIHADGTVVSFQVHGYAREFTREMSEEEGRALATSIWAVGKRTDWEARKTCDTAFEFEHEGRAYGIRGGSMVDVRGNSVVCRIRDRRMVVPLEKCGYSEQVEQYIRRICRAPGGLVLVTGETNSGKSTVVSALLSELPKSQRIIEIADPVEVIFDHVTHVQVDRYAEDAEAEFRRVLAGLVRQDPDVLSLGEIRDAWTAEAAVDMAMQGKRVYATMHTKECVGAIPRLMELGVGRSAASTRGFIAGIVNQNLVPLVCPSCGAKRHPDAAEDERLRRRFGDGVRFISPDPTECARCNGSGVAGQTLVAEVYPLCLDRTGESRRMIRQDDFDALDRYMAKEFGVASKHEHAAVKIREGLIDPSETERIIGEFDGNVKRGEKVVELHGQARQ